MDDNELRNQLQNLQDEIKNTPAVDDKGAQMLRELDADIRALLERSAESHLQIQASFTQRLEGTLYHFEVTHPDLTALISRLMESLSNAGI